MKIGSSYHLEGLKELAKRDQDLALRQACQEFEALFLYEVLKGLRRTVPEGGLFPKSFAEKMYEDLYFQEVARRMSLKGTGLGKLLYKELSQKYGGKR